MPAIKLNYIELPAADLEATKAFYASHFGWVFTDYGPTYAAAQVSGNEIALNAEAQVGPAHRDGDQNAIGPLVLLETDDLDAVSAAIASDSSDAIVTSPYEYPGGRRLHFRDPSGNVLGVYQTATS